MLSFRSRILLAASLIACGFTSAPRCEAAAPPNVVLIIGDDQGYTDFGFMGSKHVQTPRLDKLAAESLVFKRGYVTNSLCRPSLAAILTGLYPHQHGVTSNDPPGPKGANKNKPARGADFEKLRAEQTAHYAAHPNLATMLGERGYPSFQTGKWWEGDFKRGGFTHGMTTGQRHGDAGLTIGRETMQPIYDFVDGAVKEQKPFFVWYAPLLPHTPHNPPERLLKKYLDKAPDEGTAKYWAMCEWCDETCGQLLDFLDDRKLRENTLVVYITDNGWIQGADNNRAKQSPFDFGHRTPITLRLPGKIEPGENNEFAMSIDLAPTILKVCGLKPTAEMQGVDLLDAKAVAARKQIFGEIFTHNAVDLDVPASSLRYRWAREGNWKLIVPAKQNEPDAVVQLYDVEADPEERKNLAAEHADVVARLTAAMNQWWDAAPSKLSHDKVSLNPVVHDGQLALADEGRREEAPAKQAKKPKAAEVVSNETPYWVWAAEKAPLGDTRQRVWLRKKFRIKNPVSSAKLYITGDDGLNVYIDGKDALSSDSWQTPVYKDVTKLLQSKDRADGTGKGADGTGDHVITVEARNDAGSAGVLIKLVVEPFRGQPQIVATDKTWKAMHGPAEGDWMSVAYDDKKWPAAKEIEALGAGKSAWSKKVNEKTLTAGANLKVPTATPIDGMKVAKDFRVELLYSVPKEVEGSWVSMCMDPKGRLIVCDEHGGLFRLTLPPVGKTEAPKIEKIDVPIGEAQGMLWAFDSLYVNVNARTPAFQSGLYRVRDTNNDDQLDTVESLRPLVGKGDHGPHAVLLAPDGKGLYIVCGNSTKLTEISDSRVPRHYGEDHLLPRMPDGRGFMSGTLAPGGCIYRVDPEGKNWELVANGFRNEYDAAFNREGDLFSYDADMEWDMNTPWYRPTRVNHVISGAEFGWRNGAGKWPAYYADSFGAVVNIGPGSPTGVTFGYGAKFPAKYQDALYICDWSYGVMYAVHMTPDGASYKGTLEPFVQGTPLPLTDLVVNPNDGAMYFAIGGRKVQCGLYRVTYVGDESTEPTKIVPDAGTELRALRRMLESFHRPDPSAVATAWPYFGHEDRAIRFAARTAIEHQPVGEWRAKALAEKNPRASIHALLALARSSAACPKHREEGAAEPDAKLGAEILAALEKIDYAALPHSEKLDYVRVHHVLFNRFGKPNDADRTRTIARFDAVFPAESRQLNAEICNLLVYLEAPSAAAKTMALLESAPTQEEQIDFARALRVLQTGWTPKLREAYFRWLVKSTGYKGGASFALNMQNIRKDAIASLTAEEKSALGDLLEAKVAETTVVVAPPRPLVKEWKPEEIYALVDAGLKNRNFDRGRQMFAAANCFACHRFDNEGGAIGPDLSMLAGRFSVRDVLESVVDPSKVISDQYAAVTVVTTDGRIITGRIINLSGDSMRINTNMLDPSAIEGIDRKTIDEQFPSKLSMMPTGLLNTLHEDEMLDLLAYLLSRGDRNHAMFQKPTAGGQ